MNLTVLCNDEKNDGFFFEHGFSLLLEKDGKKILFDTGHTDIYLKNAELLNINLSESDVVVLSHSHYDHGGGIDYLLDKKAKFKLYIHEKALLPKYSENTFKGINLKKISSYKNLIKVNKKKAEIIKDVYSFGPASMTNEFEEPNKIFLIEKNGEKTRDFFEDELNLVIDTLEGLILITGCAHRGIVNIAKDTIKEFKKDIKLIVGGFHLKDATEEKIMKVIYELNNLNIMEVMPCHCTGNKAMSFFKKYFKNKVLDCKIGNVF